MHLQMLKATSLTDYKLIAMNAHIYGAVECLQDEDWVAFLFRMGVKGYEMGFMNL